MPVREGGMDGRMDGWRLNTLVEWRDLTADILVVVEGGRGLLVLIGPSQPAEPTGLL
jgi:hypothetical protein